MKLFCVKRIIKHLFKTCGLWLENKENTGIQIKTIKNINNEDFKCHRKNLRNQKSQRQRNQYKKAYMLAHKF